MLALFGLSAAVLYGAADFLGGIAARRTSAFSVALIAQAAGFAALLVALPFFGGYPFGRACEFGLLAGVCIGAGITLFYRALAIGTMGVVSPLTALPAAAIPVFVAVARGDRLSAANLCGIAMALIAIALISANIEPSARPRFGGAGIPEALTAGMVLGGFYVFLSMAGSGTGLYPLVWARIGSICVIALMALIARSAIVPGLATLPTILAGGILDMAANALYLYAEHGGNLAAAAVLTSLYPAATVVLARITLGERLKVLQKLGVAIALAGVALIAG